MKLRSKLTDTITQLRLTARCLHAADESGGNIAKKFQQLGVQDTPENRIAYRGAMFTTDGYGKVIGGTILFDETFRQAYEGNSVTSILTQQDVVIGIKVDSGLQPFGGSRIEQIGKNELAALPKRIEEYAAKEVQFTKFRVVGNIGDESGKSLPSDECLAANAELLAEYAEICHRFEIVPIIEPEVPMDGSHSLEDSRQATERFLKATFVAFKKKQIALPGVILKTNMILAGTQAPKADDADCIRETIATLAAIVRSDIGAMVFLSGGQDTEGAMTRLEGMRNAAARSGLAFTVSSSFSRALQRPALEEFGAAVRDRASASEIKWRTQTKFAEALKLNGMALNNSASVPG